MKKNKYFILPFVLIFCVTLLLFGNIHKDSQLSTLKINNAEFMTILDSLLKHEKSLDYYSDSLLFSIHVQKNNDITLIQVGSIGNRIIKRGDELGCFIYKEHFFIVTGGSIEETIFEITDKKENVSYYLPKDSIDSSGVVYIDVYEDDTYTYWNYRYYEGHFYKL